MCSRPEKGITRARQRGFLSARGDILAYVDAERTRPAGWIEQIWEQFGKTQGSASLSGPYSFYDLSGLRNEVSRGWFVAARPLYGIIGYMLVGGNFAIRRDVLEKMGGFDELDRILRRGCRHRQACQETRQGAVLTALRDADVGTADEETGLREDGGHLFRQLLYRSSSAASRPPRAMRTCGRHVAIEW